MEYSAESIRFLHSAYALMALGQILYVAFLVRRWTRANAALERAKQSDG
jgi:DNA-binding MurR/RpiR family transcriptional regulator